MTWFGGLGVYCAVSFGWIWRGWLFEAAASAGGQDRAVRRSEGL